MIFFPFFFPTALLFFKFASFSSQEITTTSKSRSRTDTCDLLLLLLLIIIYFIFNSPRGPARPAVVVVPAPCSGLTFLSTYWCRSVLLCLLFLLFLLLPLLMLLFLFLLSSLALAQLASLFSVFLVHRALTAPLPGAVTCDFFFSLSEGRALLLFDVSFSLTQSFTFCCFCCCCCCCCCITYIYFNFSTSTLTHGLHILLWLAGWLFNRENYYLPSANAKFSQEVSFSRIPHGKTRTDFHKPAEDFLSSALVVSCSPVPGWGCGNLPKEIVLHGRSQSPQTLTHTPALTHEGLPRDLSKREKKSPKRTEKFSTSRDSRNEKSGKLVHLPEMHLPRVRVRFRRNFTRDRGEKLLFSAPL